MGRLLSIGEVADRLGVSVDVVRSMEERGELGAIRTTGGHRRFRVEDVGRLKAKLHATHSKFLTGRSETSTRRTATHPKPRPRPVEPNLAESDIEEEADPDDLEASEAERRAAKEQAAAEAQARAAETDAERRRLEGLKKYGLELASWALLPTEWRARVVEDLEHCVTSKRLPVWNSTADAQQMVKARVDSIIEEYHDEEERRREEDDEQRRIASLTAYGNSYARSETWNWDSSDRDRARRDVERALREEVKADWTEADVKDLVDDELAEWEEDEPEPESW